MTTLTIGKRIGEFLLSEANGTRSREQVTFGALTGALESGTVVAKITKGAATSVAAGGNAGNGAMGAITLGALAIVGAYALACIAAPAGAITTPTTGTAGTNTGGGTCTSVSAGAQARAGTYLLTCIAAASNAGTFSVRSPDGDRLPDATVGVAYTNVQINFTLNDVGTDFIVGDTFTIAATAAAGNVGTFSVHTPLGERLADLTVGSAYAGSHLNMTLADGSTDFAVGDRFTITVAAGSGKWAPYDDTHVNGTEVAAGVLYTPLPISNADQTAVVIARDAEVASTQLTGSDAAAVVDLAELGVLVR